MVIIWEGIKKINNIMDEKKEELYDLMKKHIIAQFKNDSETGYDKGYNGASLRQERSEIINKLLD